MANTAARDLEILVTKIQAKLAPDAIVEHDVALPGRLSGRGRQIDILVRQRIGQYEIRIVLDCKDYSRPVDVKGVEEFHGLLQDVGAHKGALVCPRGFTGAAKVRAEGLQISLYSPVDTDPHKWQVAVRIPVLCDFAEAAIAFGLKISSMGPVSIPADFFSTAHAYDITGNDLGLPADLALAKWDDGLYPMEAGLHSDLPIFNQRTYVDNGYGGRSEAELYVNLRVKRRLYFSYLDIEEISGFKDELSGAVIANAFKTGILDVEEVTKTWQVIESEDSLPVRPFLRMTGLFGLSE